MIVGSAETADLCAAFPQKPLGFLCIQAARDVSKIYDAYRAGGQRPAFTQDLNAPVLIKGQPPIRRRHHHEKLFGLWPQPEPPLQLLKPSSDRPHDFFLLMSSRTARSRAFTSPTSTGGTYSPRSLAACKRSLIAWIRAIKNRFASPSGCAANPYARLRSSSF
jgi:hypothetical protein